MQFGLKLKIKVEEKEVEETKKQIKSVLNTAADKNFITTEKLKSQSQFYWC